MPNWIPNLDKDSAGKLISQLSILGPFGNFSCLAEEELSIVNQYFSSGDLTQEQFKIVAQGLRPLIHALRVC